MVAVFYDVCASSSSSSSGVASGLPKAGRVHRMRMIVHIEFKGGETRIANALRKGKMGRRALLKGVIRDNSTRVY